MRVALRTLLCLAAWLMSSPLAMAAVPCETQSTRSDISPCCDSTDGCGMPDMGDVEPCFKCPPIMPLASLPAIAPDVAPPLMLAFERPIPITIEVLSVGEAFAVVLFHPPPPTLLALGTLLSC